MPECTKSYFNFHFFRGNTPKGVEFIEFLFTKRETLDSYRCETKMRQNAPNPISISIFSRGNTSKGEELNFNFFCILNVYRESLHTFNMQSNTMQQYNCNQERIENDQLIGFANARPSTGI